MKKILCIALLIGLSFGCEEECVSNCGTITNDEIIGDCYSLTIQNECSDNFETWCFSESVWMNNYVGDEFCVSNVTSW